MNSKTCLAKLSRTAPFPVILNTFPAPASYTLPLALERVAKGSIAKAPLPNFLLEELSMFGIVSPA